MIRGSRDGNVEESYCQRADSFDKVSGVKKKSNSQSMDSAMGASLSLRQKATYPNKFPDTFNESDYG